ncbi:MAG: hypothetical protein E3K37_08845 [Candidatus Kuenenia sp.]|nr:hypothetical protein [Candidatus Kuenenia hertensis]
MKNKESLLAMATVKYTIGYDDRFVYVSPSWSVFAKENGAPQLADNAVIGRLIFDFLTGIDCKELYRMIFKHCRESNRKLIFPFRCDSPNIKRFMELHIISDSQGKLHFEAQLLKVTPRKYNVLLAKCTHRSDRMIKICSWCKLVEISKDHWVDIDTALEQHGLFNESDIPKLTHGICPNCYVSFASRYKK